MLAEAVLLFATVGIGSAPCAVPASPAPALAPYLLPRVIVRAQSGAVFAVLLSWHLELDAAVHERRAPPERAATGAPLDHDETEALESALRCP